MAKINHAVASIKTVLETSGVKPEKGKRTTKKTTRYLLALFSLVDDVRVPILIQYPLDYIILITFLAVLGGANTWQEISDFGNSMRKWLGKFIDVKKYGIPSHDTFRRVFGLLDPKQLETVVVDVIRENLAVIKKNLHIESTGDEYRLLCIDGKEENGTGRKYCSSSQSKVRNAQTLHVYDYSNQVCLVSVPIETKTNEIPAAQAILETMDLSDTVCTFDALHMQRNTIAIIRNKRGHYVGGLKGNQQGLMQEAAEQFSDDKIEKLRTSRKTSNPVYIVTEEHAHSQQEKREYFLVKLRKDEERDSKWEGLRSFTMCIKTIIPDNPGMQETTEVRYYASDLDDLSVISEAIRSHWSVEQFHWQLDVSFREDDNTTMDVTAYNNLSLINKLCLHLIQLMKLRDTKTSVNRIRKKFGWNFEDSMENLLSFFHEEAIIQALTAEKVSSLILSDK